jgi:hypothetical protein
VDAIVTVEIDGKIRKFEVVLLSPDQRARGQNTEDRLRIWLDGLDDWCEVS